MTMGLHWPTIAVWGPRCYLLLGCCRGYADTNGIMEMPARMKQIRAPRAPNLRCCFDSGSYFVGSCTAGRLLKVSKPIGLTQGIIFSAVDSF